MPLVSDRCICLRKFEYSETSQILALFARERGIFRAIAKGAHRRSKAGAGKFDGGVDLLDVGQAVFTHDPARDLSTLTEWSLREGNLELRRDLRSIHLALYGAELVGLLLEEHDPHPNLFDRLERLPQQLATPGREEAFLSFELKLLRASGHLADWSLCAHCGRSLDEREPAHFSAARGGLLCGHCAGAATDAMPLDIRLARLVRGMLRPPRDPNSPQRLPRLTRHQTDPINRVLLAHIEHTLGRRTRMGRLIG